MRLMRIKKCLQITSDVTRQAAASRAIKINMLGGGKEDASWRAPLVSVPRCRSLKVQYCTYKTDIHGKDRGGRAVIL